MRKYLLLAFIVAISGVAKAQDPHFSQFFASPLTLNPAFTGKFDGSWRLAANHRDQWPSIPKAYVTTSASFDFPILKNSIPENDVFGVGTEKRRGFFSFCRNDRSQKQCNSHDRSYI